MGLLGWIFNPKRIILLFVIALIFLLGRTIVFAAVPLPVVLEETFAYRNVLERHDFLALSRYRLAIEPDPRAASDTFTGFAVDGSGNVQDMVLVNRHSQGDTTNMVVTEDGGPTTITGFCTLAGDRRTVSCDGTGLGAGTFTFTITYEDGWNAYSTDAVIYSYTSNSVTMERAVPSISYALVGLYQSTVTITDNFTGNGVTTDFVLTGVPFYTDETGFVVTVGGVAQTPVTDFTHDDANGEIDFTSPPADTLAIVVQYPETGDLQWGSGTATLEGNPTFWSVPSSTTQAPTLRATSTVAATATQLTTDLRSMLRDLENFDPDIADGTYVVAQGITDVGQLLAVQAFSGITQAIPDAFISGLEFYQPDLSTPESGYIAGVVATAQAEEVYLAFVNLGDEFGTTGTVAALVIFLGLFVVMVAVSVRFLPSSAVWPAVLVGMISLMFVGVFIGMVPPLWLFLGVGLLFAAGALWWWGRRAMG